MFRRRARQPERGVQLVHRAARLDARMGFRDAPAIHQSRRAVIPGFGRNAHADQLTRSIAFAKQNLRGRRWCGAARFKPSARAWFFARAVLMLPAAIKRFNGPPAAPFRFLQARQHVQSGFSIKFQTPTKPMKSIVMVSCIFAAAVKLAVAGEVTLSLKQTEGLKCSCTLSNATGQQIYVMPLYLKEQFFARPCGRTVLRAGRLAAVSSRRLDGFGSSGLRYSPSVYRHGKHSAPMAHHLPGFNRAVSHDQRGRAGGNEQNYNSFG